MHAHGHRHEDETPPPRVPPSGAGTIGAPPAEEDGTRDTGAAAPVPGTRGALLALRDALGTTVLDRDGVAIGTIEDITVDRDTGHVAYALVAGEGKHRYVLPWRALSAERGEFRVALALAGLSPDAGIDPQFWPELARDERWARRLHERFGVDPYWGRGPWIDEDD